MSDCGHTLGIIVKEAREKKGLTQTDLASVVQKDPRTILNIENFKGNPRLDLLEALIKSLNIDARDIFEQLNNDGPECKRQLAILIDTLSEDEARALMPVIEQLINAFRQNVLSKIK